MALSKFPLPISKMAASQEGLAVAHLLPLVPGLRKDVRELPPYLFHRLTKIHLLINYVCVNCSYPSLTTRPDPVSPEWSILPGVGPHQPPWPNWAYGPVWWSNIAKEEWTSPAQKILFCKNRTCTKEEMLIENEQRTGIHVSQNQRNVNQNRKEVIFKYPIRRTFKT